MVATHPVGKQVINPAKGAVLFPVFVEPIRVLLPFKGVCWPEVNRKWLAGLNPPGAVPPVGLANPRTLTVHHSDIAAIKGKAPQGLDRRCQGLSIGRPVGEHHVNESEKRISLLSHHLPSPLQAF